jgi:hypothetical protein
VRTIRDLVGEFLSAMGRKAMHHNDVFIGFINKFLIDLIGREYVLPFFSFCFLPHARPGISINDMGILDRGMRISDKIYT